MVSCLATAYGRRRDSGVTIVPIRTWSVTCATAPSRTHGSSGATSALHCTWSHRKTPSQPAASASRAQTTTVAASVNGGMLTACLMSPL